MENIIDSHSFILLTIYTCNSHISGLFILEKYYETSSIGFCWICLFIHNLNLVIFGSFIGETKKNGKWRDWVYMLVPTLFIWSCHSVTVSARCSRNDKLWSYGINCCFWANTYFVNHHILIYFCSVLHTQPISSLLRNVSSWSSL